MHIFELRYQGRFEYSIDISDEVMDLSILKMTLQPIIENSIHHGFQNYAGLMRIDIQIWRENDFVIISVNDNGDGISSEREQEINLTIQEGNNQGLNFDKNSSFGLENVSRRLKLAFGDQYQFEISRLQKGTSVIMTIPAIQLDRDVAVF